MGCRHHTGTLFYNVEQCSIFLQNEEKVKSFAQGGSGAITLGRPRLEEGVRLEKRLGGQATPYRAIERRVLCRLAQMKPDKAEAQATAVSIGIDTCFSN
jgi:hypothetical protein